MKRSRAARFDPHARGTDLNSSGLSLFQREMFLLLRTQIFIFLNNKKSSWRWDENRTAWGVKICETYFDSFLRACFCVIATWTLRASSAGQPCCWAMCFRQQDTRFNDIVKSPTWLIREKSRHDCWWLILRMNSRGVICWWFFFHALFFFFFFSLLLEHLAECQSILIV